MTSVAWRGVVVGGEVQAWPTSLMTHDEAFRVMPVLKRYTARWRQWTPGGPIDFDSGASSHDIALVERFLTNVNLVNN